MKLTAYLRVSTDKQAEHGFGLDVQRQAITKWAKANRHQVVSWHTDEGISGSNGLDTRDALGGALDDLEAHRADGLVVPRLDRLSRDVILQETLLRDIHGAGHKVFSTMPGEQSVIEDDPEDPSRELMRVIIGAVAVYERKLIRLRMRHGQRRKAALGGYAGGAPRYGFRAEGRELVPVPAEQATIARARELRAEGQSIRAIAEVLTAEGHTPKKGGRWHVEQLRRILARSA
jgi:DNA invertase Pin-like site-specific DNA recombinase